MKTLFLCILALLLLTSECRKNFENERTLTSSSVETDVEYLNDKRIKFGHDKEKNKNIFKPEACNFLCEVREDPPCNSWTWYPDFKCFLYSDVEPTLRNRTGSVTGLMKKAPPLVK